MTEFAEGYDFALDPFQIQAAEALEEGEGVLVCAPTGAGKTVVGEFAVHLALREGRKCFYTTPIKALSNQKYADLIARHGAENVGLLTGDNAVNGEAPIVVMTTEVLRNMLYAGSPALRGLGFVVMDEVHYLADKFRGAVWEEVIIHLPASVRLVSLSATVSNAEEFAEWLVTVRGHTRVVVSEARPVPLLQHMQVGRQLFDLFEDAESLEVDPDLVRTIRDEERRAGGPPPGRRGRSRQPHPQRRRFRPPDRVTVIERLDREGLLPAIVFVFSRAGCDAAVARCRSAGLRLTTAEERAQIRAVIDRRAAALPSEDLHVLGYWEWREALEAGVAAHHAGLIPTFKETVEELFVRGLVKVVFATETLALGINMPARSVVLERLVKYNGETHADLTPGEYTQLTGRAGRRGIDVEGHAIVLWSPGLDPAQVAGLASTRTYPLRSSFRPSYNMAVNLVGQIGRAQARTLLESSFAQFQADRAVVGLAQQIQRNEEALAGYAEAMHCHLGDFTEYARMRQQLTELERRASRETAAHRRAEAHESLEGLHAGDVIRIPGGRRAGVAVVLDPGRRSGLESPAPMILTMDHRVHRLSAVDISAPVEHVQTMRIPPGFNVRSPRSRRDLASSLRNLRIEDRPRREVRGRQSDTDTEITQLRSALRRHSCHGCSDREEHARWAERHQRLERETVRLRRRVEGRTHSLARTFDRVCSVLERRGYLDPDSESGVSDDGRRLARIWSESDLLVAECLRNDAWRGLDAPELAAVVSTLVYESRSGERPGGPVPHQIEDALTATRRLWNELNEDEREADLTRTAEPDPGFAWAALRWARGESLERALLAGDVAGEPIPAGDFVRWCKQLVDLLDQISAADPGPVGRAAHTAVGSIVRGVVASATLG
ncbi:MAG TPA: DEAD/DEAH box helicase [Mycobacteriales bacterium]|nr:DEAD/DEAH box helicase [Mycobacteriales bacterium]